MPLRASQCTTPQGGGDDSMLALLSSLNADAKRAGETESPTAASADDDAAADGAVSVSKTLD